MNCPDTRILLHAYFDRGLDLVRSLEIESHLRGCPHCDGTYQSLETLRKGLRGSELYFHAPPTLASRVRSRVRQAGLPVARTRSVAWHWDWAVAAMAMVAVAIAGIALSVSRRHSAGELMAQEVVSAHVRSLMANHSTDVASTDQHTVKPWFAGKLDYSPPVIDLAPEDFPLVGGRLDYLAGRPVAALIYARRKHVINLFIWPSRESPNLAHAGAPINGFNVVRWTQAGMEWWAVSDLNAQELWQFADLVRARVAGSK